MCGGGETARWKNPDREIIRKLKDLQIIQKLPEWYFKIEIVSDGISADQDVDAAPLKANINKAPHVF